MFRTFTLLTALTLMALAPAAVAHGTDDRSGPNPGQSARNDNNGDETPYAGRDLGYDYVTDEYYTYTGPEPKDRRAGEQDGYRTGVLHTQRAAYRARSRYGYSGCGCAAYVSRHERSYRQMDERRAPY